MLRKRSTATRVASCPATSWTTSAAGDRLLLSKHRLSYNRHIILNGTPIDIPARAIVLVQRRQLECPADCQCRRGGRRTLAEGDRVVVSHSVLSDDPAFDHAIVRNVEVTVHDNDQAAILLTHWIRSASAVSPVRQPPGRQQLGRPQGTTATDPPPVTEVTDLYAIELAKAPGKTVRVDIKPNDERVSLTAADRGIADCRLQIERQVRTVASLQSQICNLQSVLKISACGRDPRRVPCSKAALRRWWPP